MNFQKDILPFIPQAVLGVTVLVGLLNYRSRPRYFKAFAFFWLFIFLSEITGHALARVNVKNHWLYNISFTSIYIFLPWFFSRFPSAKFIIRLLPSYYAVFTVIFLLNVIFWQSPDELLTNIIVAGGLPIVIFSAWYLGQLYKSEEIERIQNDPHFWMSAGFLFYFGATVPFWGMLNYLWQNFPGFTRMYHFIISYGFIFLLNLLICISYLCRTTNSRK